MPSGLPETFSNEARSSDTKTTLATILRRSVTPARAECELEIYTTMRQNRNLQQMAVTWSKDWNWYEEIMTFTSASSSIKDHVFQRQFCALGTVIGWSIQRVFHSRPVETYEVCRPTSGKYNFPEYLIVTTNIRGRRQNETLFLNLRIQLLRQQFDKLWVASKYEMTCKEHAWYKRNLWQRDIPCTVVADAKPTNLALECLAIFVYVNEQHNNQPSLLFWKGFYWIRLLWLWLNHPLDGFNAARVYQSFNKSTRCTQTAGTLIDEISFAIYLRKCSLKKRHKNHALT